MVQLVIFDELLEFAHPGLKSKCVGEVLEHDLQRASTHLECKLVESHIKLVYHEVGSRHELCPQAFFVQVAHHVFESCKQDFVLVLGGEWYKVSQAASFVSVGWRHDEFLGEVLCGHDG